MITIGGTCLTAAMVRGCLQHEGFTLALDGSKYNFEIDEGGDVVTLDSVDGPLEAAVFRYVQDLAGIVTVKRAGGNQDAWRMVLTVPANDKAREAVMLGILRALTTLTNHVPPRARGRRWFWPFLIFLMLNSINAAAQTSEVKVTYGSNTAHINASGRLEITCPDGSCAGGGAVTGTVDRDPFTESLSGVNLYAGVFDESLTQLVADGQIVAARVTSFRALHVQFYDGSSAIGVSSNPMWIQGDIFLTTQSFGRVDAANAAPGASDVGLIVRNIPTGTQAVSGTFWQTTQPVSGTFWQTTQPVSLASVPSHAVTNAGTFAVQVTSAPTTAVTGTFFQATQPVSSTQFPAALAANGGLKIEGVASGVAVPVSGTFFQGTQPVSGPLTDTQLRATPVPVSGTVTATGPLTDTQLRATPVPVSGTVTASGPVTDTQLRATPVPVSGTVTVTPPTLTKGTQGATGFSVQNLRDAGRTAISFYANAVASGTTGTETLITLTQSKGTGATSSASTYTITSGKTLRITAIQVGSRGNATATIQITTFNLRLNTAGACVVTSTPILMGIATATPATASAWDRSLLTLGDGYEIAGNGTIALCISANAVFVTNAPTWFVNIIGYEY